MLSVAVFDMWENGNPGDVAALGFLQLIASSVIVGLSDRRSRAPLRVVFAILGHEVLGMRRRQKGCASRHRSSFRQAAAVKRQVCAARAAHHQCSPVAATLGAASGWDTIASATPNSSSSSAVLAGDWSKFDTVTPSSRMPLAIGSSVRTSSRLA